MSEQVVLEGHISVRAALIAGNRSISVIYIRRNSAQHAVFDIPHLAKEHGVKIKYVSDDTIAAHVTGRSHGGIIALAGPRGFLSLEDLATDKKTPFVVMLDGIEDPFNFGVAVRALYAAGVDGLVVRTRNWINATGVVARASAGASELIATAQTETIHDAANFFRQRGLTIACTTHHKQATSIYDANLVIPLFLIIGGERRGITRSFAKQGDLFLHIPVLPHNAPALTSATATAIIAFEVLRQSALQAQEQKSVTENMESSGSTTD